MKNTGTSVVNTEAEQVRHGLQIGRERRDHPDVEVAVGPPVEPMADAGGKRVVHGGVAERALDADRFQASVRVERASQTHHGTQLEQGKRCRGVVEIDLAGRDLLPADYWKRSGRYDSLKDTALIYAFLLDQLGVSN